jgi:hypothetical protein
MGPLSVICVWFLFFFLLVASVLWLYPGPLHASGLFLVSLLLFLRFLSPVFMFNCNHYSVVLHLLLLLLFAFLFAVSSFGSCCDAFFLCVLFVEFQVALQLCFMALCVCLRSFILFHFLVTLRFTIFWFYSLVVVFFLMDFLSVAFTIYFDFTFLYFELFFFCLLSSILLYCSLFPFSCWQLPVFSFNGFSVTSL